MKKLFELIIALMVLVFCVSGCYYNPFKTERQKIIEMQFEGDYIGTLTPLGEMLKKNPNNTETHRLMGISNLNLGNFEIAEINFFNVTDKLKSEEEKKLARNEIIFEYKKVFLLYLNKNDKEKREKAEKLFVAMCNLNPDKDLLEKLRKYLENEGNNRLSKNSFTMADNYFSYLLRLNPNSKQGIAQAYLDLFNQTDDSDKFKTIIIDRAVEISQEQNITKAHGEHYCKLSEQAETTEGAIAKLEVANRFGNLYSHKLKAKQDLLKQEQFLTVVKKYESQWGPAKVVRLTEPNKWKEVFPMNNQENFHYLSLKSFYANDKKCSDGQIDFDSAIKKHGEFRVSCKKPITLYCSALHTPITLYAWKM